MESSYKNIRGQAIENFMLQCLDSDFTSQNVLPEWLLPCVALIAMDKPGALDSLIDNMSNESPMPAWAQIMVVSLVNDICNKRFDEPAATATEIVKRDPIEAANDEPRSHTTVNVAVAVSRPNGRPPISNEIASKVVEAIDNGRPIGETAEAIGIHRNAATKIIEQAREKEIACDPPTPEQIAAIYGYWVNGKHCETQKEAAEIIGCSVPTFQTKTFGKREITYRGYKIIASDLIVDRQKSYDDEVDPAPAATAEAMPHAAGNATEQSTSFGCGYFVDSEYYPAEEAANVVGCSVNELGRSCPGAKEVTIWRHKVQRARKSDDDLARNLAEHKGRKNKWICNPCGHTIGVDPIGRVPAVRCAKCQASSWSKIRSVEVEVTP